MVEWENGEITSKPLSIIAADDPVTCTIYAKDNDLLLTPGWKCFKSIANWQKKLFCMANQAKLCLFCTAPRYKYGYEVLWDYKPKTLYSSPLKRGDHPELDTSELLDPQGVQDYQSIVRSLQWAISLGRLDIATAVMSLLSFRGSLIRDTLTKPRESLDTCQR